MLLAWGAKVSPTFRDKVVLIAAGSGGLAMDPSDLMACMAFESGETFSPSITNGAGSGATGLIQFMPQTAGQLGTTTAKLAAMKAEEQMDYVLRYFKPYAGRLHTIDDVYMAILWPAAIGKASSYVLFDKADPLYPKRYVQNHGLDLNSDGRVTKAEAAARVRDKLQKGLTAPYVYRSNP